MWSQVIVIVTPCLDGLARLGEGEEDVLVEAFVPQPAVGRFDESVLHRLAGFDVVPLQSAGGPTQHCAAGELGPVVANHHPWQCALSCWRRSSSRTTRTPPSEVSTTVARHRIRG